MESLVVFVVAFIIIFAVNLIIYFYRRIRGNLSNMKEFDILASKFKLKRSNLNYKSLGFIMCLVNSLIISIAGTLCTMVDLNYIWQLLIGFALIMSFILISYGLIGKILKRREMKVKNGRKKN